MEVVIGANINDRYEKYAAGATPAGFAKEFLAIHALESKPFRIHAISSGNPARENRVLRENAYKTVADATGGHYYVWDTSLTAVNEAFAQLGMEAVQRAYVYAKHSIKLSHVVSDPATIKVSIGGVEIPGNIGSPNDVWYYVADTNTVEIRWNLINLSALSPGAQVLIRYQGLVQRR